MKKNIYIFTSRSKSPDLYVNILGNYLYQFGEESIEEIVLLKLAENIEERIFDLNDLKQIRENIEIQVKNLSEQKFIKWLNDGTQIDKPQQVLINEDFIKIYNKLLKIINQEEIRIKVLFNKEIDRKIEKLVSDRSSEYIFDLTGVVKRDFIRIGLILLELEGNIFLFETHKPFERNEKDLIHELVLTPNSYSYTKLNPQNYSVVKKTSGLNLINHKSELKKNLALGKTEEVIKELIEYLTISQKEESHFKDEIINASSRYFRTKNSFITGTLPDEKFELEINKINSLLLEIIDKI